MSDNKIRFIDSRYKELFRIPDGSAVKITMKDGEELFGKCQYIDDYHFKFIQNGREYGDTYHICQFAEINERNNNTVEPMTDYEYQVRSDLGCVLRHLSAVNKDKFFKTDNGFTEVYYNPDSTAGGQIVYVQISENDIKEAAAHSKHPKDFFDHLSSIGKCCLIDIGTPEFQVNFESFVNRSADFEGCTKKTMDELKKSVGIMPKHKDMER